MLAGEEGVEAAGFMFPVCWNGRDKVSLSDHCSVCIFIYIQLQLVGIDSTKPPAVVL